MNDYLDSSYISIYKLYGKNEKIPGVPRKNNNFPNYSMENYSIIIPDNGRCTEIFSDVYIRGRISISMYAVYTV